VDVAQTHFGLNCVTNVEAVVVFLGIITSRKPGSAARGGWFRGLCAIYWRERYPSFRASGSVDQAWRKMWFVVNDRMFMVCIDR